MQLVHRRDAALEVECPSGKFSTGDADKCTHCPRGYVQPGEGHSSCGRCLSGEYIKLDSFENGFDNKVRDCAWLVLVISALRTD
jgi:hypothetical protein